MKHGVKGLPVSLGKGITCCVFAVLCLLSLPPTSAAEQEPLPLKLSDAIQRVSELPGFSCRFRQSIIYSDGSTQHYSGSLAVLPPESFRWQYTLPYEQLIVSNGEKLWHYEPDLMQVRILVDLEDVDPVVMQLLAGQIQLDELSLLENEDAKGRYSIRIKDGPEVWLGLSKQGLIAYVETLDALANRNRIELSEWVLKKPASDKFIFHAPEGVDIVEQ